MKIHSVAAVGVPGLLLMLARRQSAVATGADICELFHERT